MKVFVDATTLISLGRLGELELLTAFDGDVRVPRAVLDAVTTQPAEHNVDVFASSHAVLADPVPDEYLDEASAVLGDGEVTGDAEIVARVLAADGAVGVVSDDRRVRTTAEGLGATVTGTIGVVVRAVTEGPDTSGGCSAAAGKSIVRRLDDGGLHTTATLRERALTLVEEAGPDRE